MGCGKSTQASVKVTEFKVGDRVSTSRGLGTVVEIDGVYVNTYLVEHDTWTGGHNGHDLRSLYNKLWWYIANELTKVEDETVEKDGEVTIYPQFNHDVVVGDLVKINDRRHFWNAFATGAVVEVKGVNHIGIEVYGHTPNGQAIYQTLARGDFDLVYHSPAVTPETITIDLDLPQADAEDLLFEIGKLIERYKQANPRLKAA